MSLPLKVSLIILTHNNLDLTRVCLDSIYSKTDYPDFEVIIVDNASKDDTPQYLHEQALQHSNLKIVLNLKNEGFPRGNNMGAAAASGDYLVFLNNDTVVTRGWLSGLTRHLQDPTVGMVGPVTNSSGNETRIAVDYKTLAEMDEFADRYTQSHLDKTFEIKMLPFLCVALRRQVFEKIGPLDERFGMGMFEDDDYALRSRQAGYTNICAEDVFIHHLGSASFAKMDSEQYWRLFKQNMHKFEEKWGTRWLPPALRPEFFREHLREMVNASIYFTDLIMERGETIRALEISVSKLETQSSELNQQSVDLQEQLGKSNQQIADLKNQLVSANTQISEFQAAIQKSYQQIDEFRELLKDKQKQLADSQRQIVEMGQQVENSHKQYTDLQVYVADLQQQVTSLNSHLAQSAQSINWLNVQLNAIYASNGWTFLQTLLRIRRFFVPEGSKRERIFRQAIQSVRERKLKGFKSSLKVMFREKKISPQPESTVTKETTPIPEEKLVTRAISVQSSHLPDRFPWPLVSVILPVYNHADMLEGAARSVLFNTYPHLELIILDDGSTDAIEPVLARLLTNPRVRVYRQPNQKLPRALTHAHQLAKGEMITWTSSDNLLAPGALSAMVDALLQHPEAVLVYSDVAVIDDEGKPLTDPSYRPQNQDISRPDIIRLHRDAQALGCEADNYINACFLYRRQSALALEGHFADDLRGLEDYDFWLRLQKCGKFIHLGNIEPLYYYRVHNRTMSHELLSQERDRQAHSQRVEHLIQYEAQRKKYTQLRWDFVIDETLSQDEKSFLINTAACLPVNISFENKGWQPDQKILHFVDPSVKPGDRVYVKALPGYWQLAWRSPGTGEEKTLDIWKGIDIHPLALKARDYRKNTWEFPQALQRPIIGCHLGLAELPIDLEATRQLILNNPDVFFVFADMYGKDHPSLGDKIVQGLENAVYLSTRLFGEAYQLYACFDALCIPPLTGKISNQDYRGQLALAYTIAKPLIAPYGFGFAPAPYQSYYRSPDESLSFVKALDQPRRDLLDRYLEIWTPTASLELVARLANAITQELAVSRPDFKLKPSVVTAPSSWKPHRGQSRGKMKCGLAVNTLDIGGLEEFVGQLARRLPELDIDTFIVCVKSGGKVADTLKQQGIRVYLAGGDQTSIRRVLQQEMPDLLNSHWASLELLEVASQLGIPIIETIHSSYIWLDHNEWEIEKQRSRYFTHAIATSEMTRRYYTKWNNAFAPDWITVVPNGIEPARLSLVDRSTARQQIAFPEDEFLFITVASYDGVKNHLGILTAFDQVAKKYPQTHLIFTGNIANPAYYQQVVSYWETLDSHERVHLYEYRQDIGTLLSAANVFVLDSFSEGWSIAATEALMAGLPIIHTECGSAYELVGKSGERGIVIPNPATQPINLNRQIIAELYLQKQNRNTDALTQAMTQMIMEYSQWQDKCIEIRNYALKTFSIHITSLGYENVLVKFS